MSILPSSSIQAMADAHGYTVLPETATEIASDLEYRLRELVQESNKFTRHSKRRRLSTEDINHALRLRNLDPIYGYSQVNNCDSNDPGFKRAGTTDAFYIPETQIDLTTFIKAPLPLVPQDVTFTNHWLAVEGVQPAIPQNPPVYVVGQADASGDLEPAIDTLPPTVEVSNNITDEPALKVDDIGENEGGGGEDATQGTGDTSEESSAKAVAASAVTADVPTVIKPIVKHELSREQQVYYKSVTDGLLGNDDHFRRLAVESLKEDPGLHQLLPYFSQFVAEKVTANLGCLSVLESLVQLTEALLENPNLFPEPYLHQLLPATLTCVVGKRLSATQAEDHWKLRRRAAKVVGTICKEYGRSNRIQSRVTKTMINAFMDAEKPLATHYGAVAVISALGPNVIDVILMDNIEAYGKFLKSVKAEDDITKYAIKKVKDVLLNACVNYLLHVDEKTVGGNSPVLDDEQKNRRESINILFGDELKKRLNEKRANVSQSVSN